jgi:hypothetical protein
MRKTFSRTVPKKLVSRNVASRGRLGKVEDPDVAPSAVAGEFFPIILFYSILSSF